MLEALPFLDEREIAAAFGSPRAVANYRALQEAAFKVNPDGIADANTAANNAAADAAAAQAAADAAQIAADSKLDQAAGDARYVRQDIGAAWTAPTGTASRATFATYTAPVISAVPTQAEVQGVADAVQILSRAMKALIDDLKANGALT